MVGTRYNCYFKKPVLIIADIQMLQIHSDIKVLSVCDSISAITKNKTAIPK